MNKLRLLITGLVTAMLCAVFIIACQTDDVTPEEQSLANDTLDKTETTLSSDADSDVKSDGLQFIAMNDELWQIYQDGGLQALLEYIAANGLESNSADARAQEYCNYRVKEVLDPPYPITPYPGPGWKFCVVCPPECGPFGLLYSVEPVTSDGTHYVAYAKLSQANSDCTECENQNPGAVVPRAN